LCLTGTCVKRDISVLSNNSYIPESVGVEVADQWIKSHSAGESGGWRKARVSVPRMHDCLTQDGNIGNQIQVRIAVQGAYCDSRRQPIERNRSGASESGPAGAQHDSHCRVIESCHRVIWKSVFVQVTDCNWSGNDVDEHVQRGQLKRAVTLA